MNTLGEFIRRHRLALEITQKELGERLKPFDGRGRVASTISEWENGKANVPKAILPDLAIALGVSPITLFAAAGLLDNVPGAQLLLLVEQLGLTNEEVSDAIDIIHMVHKKRG